MRPTPSRQIQPTAEFAVVDDTPFFAPASTDMIDGLIGQYQSMRRKVEEIGEYIVPRLAGGAIDYFLDGNRNDERGRNSLDRSAAQLFEVEALFEYLDGMRREVEA